MYNHDHWRTGPVSYTHLQIEYCLSTDTNACAVTLLSTEMMGNETQILFNVGDQSFTARWQGQYLLDNGSSLHVRLSPDSFHFFDAETGTLLRSALAIKGSAQKTA